MEESLTTCSPNETTSGGRMRLVAARLHAVRPLHSHLQQTMLSERQQWAVSTIGGIPSRGRFPAKVPLDIAAEALHLALRDAGAY